MKTVEPKGLILMVDERFLAEIDAAYPKLGFDSRAGFVRHAVYEELTRQGYKLPAEYKTCPSNGRAKGRPKQAPLKSLPTSAAQVKNQTKQTKPKAG